MRNVKECQLAFTERHTYGRYIKSTVQLTCVGLAQARPSNKTQIHRDAYHHHLIQATVKSAACLGGVLVLTV